MKHIGWCLEKIQIAMCHIPKEVVSPENKLRAGEIVDEVEGYAKTLAEIIQNPKFRKYVEKLSKAPIQGIQLQAHEVVKLTEDLEHMLHVLDLYIRALREIILKRPEEWKEKADQLVLMIDQKFGGEHGELRREFQVAVHTEEQLRDIVTSERHLAEFLK